MVWVGRDHKDHLVPNPLPWAGTSSTRPGCSKPHPTWPWTLPGREQPSQGNLFQCLTTLMGKEVLLCIWSKSTLFQFKAIAPSSITTCPCKKCFSIFLVGFLQVLTGCCKVSPEPSLSQAEQPLLSQPFLTGAVLQPSDHFCGPPLDLLQRVHVFGC